MMKMLCKWDGRSSTRVPIKPRYSKGCLSRGRCETQQSLVTHSGIHQTLLVDGTVPLEENSFQRAQCTVEVSCKELCSSFPSGRVKGKHKMRCGQKDYCALIVQRRIWIIRVQKSDFGIYIVLNSWFNSWPAYGSECISETLTWLSVSSQQISFIHNPMKQVSCWEGTEDFPFSFFCFFIPGNSNRKGTQTTCQRSTWRLGLFWIPVEAAMGPEQSGALSLSQAAGALITESFSVVLACWQECRYLFFFLPLCLLSFLLLLLSPMPPSTHFH